MTDTDTAAAQAPLLLTITFEERDAWHLRQEADRLSAPDATAPFLERDALRADLVALPATDRQKVIDWLAKHAIEALPDADQPPTPQVMLFTGGLDAFTDAFGPRARRWYEDRFSDRPGRMEWSLPATVRGYVKSIQVLRSDGGTAAWLRGNRWTTDAGESVMSAPISASPDGVGGVTPAQLRRLYDFPDDLTGEGEVIALLLLDAAPDVGDCQAFWQAHGIERADPEVVYIGPKPTGAPSKMERLEAAMGVQWAGAMAPGARIVTYVMDSGAVADKWAAFLMAVVADAEHAPTVASTSWLIAERDYYAAFGTRVITGLLDQCAALGVTVIAAAGDWGAFDGVPRQTYDGEQVIDAPWPHAVFPACEERVLGVGGTMVTHLDPVTELAWSSPLPPGMAAESPFQRLAGGGGFSDAVPIPDYQQFFDKSRGTRKRQGYTRGPHAPQTFAFGRGIPDVSLMAVGRTIHRPGDRGLTVDGYQAVVAGEFVDHAGGTSTGAPVWAAIVALANQARAEKGVRRLGYCNRLLYALARREREEPPFRDVTIGRTDVTVRAVDGSNNLVAWELPGYDARPDWDPVTGLGVPRVRRLIELLSTPDAGNP